MVASLLPLTRSLVVTLSDRERLHLEDELANVPDPYAHTEAACHRALRAVVTCLEPATVQLVKNFTMTPGLPGLLVLKNAPRDKALPATPIDGSRLEGKTTWIAEGFLLGLGELAGHVFSYGNEKRGELIHVVAPVPGSEMSKSNVGSYELNFHIENNAVTPRPHGLILSGQKEGSGQPITRYIEALAIAASVSAECLAALREPLFRFKTPESHRISQGADLWSEPRPVLHGPENDPELSLDFNGMEPLNDLAVRALAELKAVAGKPGVAAEMRLLPGTVALINNRRGAHQRDTFHDVYDGNQRMLMRVYFSGDLWPGRARADAQGRRF